MARKNRRGEFGRESLFFKFFGELVYTLNKKKLLSVKRKDFFPSRRALFGFYKKQFAERILNEKPPNLRALKNQKR
jgi:hypothetical protein